VTPFETGALDPSAPHTVIFQKACYEDETHTLLAGSASSEINKSLVKRSGCP
jgi:hypothetical protein